MNMANRSHGLSEFLAKSRETVEEEKGHPRQIEVTKGNKALGTWT